MLIKYTAHGAKMEVKDTMKLPYMITKFEDLPEAVRQIAQDQSLYQPVKGDDGNVTGYVLDLDDSGDQRVAGLVSKKNELLGTVKQLKDKLAGLDGIDPVEAKHAIEQLPKLQEQLKAKGKDSKVDVEAIREELKTEYDKKLQEKDGLVNVLKNSAVNGALDTAINKAFDEHKVTPNARTRELLRNYLKGQLTVEEQANGDTLNFIPRVKNDGNQNVPYKVSGKDGGDGFMTVGELVGSFKEDAEFGFAFQGSQANGGGSENNQGGSGGQDFGGVKYREDLQTTKDESAFISKHGSEAFLNLPSRPAQ